MQLPYLPTATIVLRFTYLITYFYNYLEKSVDKQTQQFEAMTVLKEYLKKVLHFQAQICLKLRKVGGKKLKEEIELNFEEKLLLCLKR